MPANELVELLCPNCGAALGKPEPTGDYACAYCGHRSRQAEAVAASAPTLDAEVPPHGEVVPSARSPWIEALRLHWLWLDGSPSGRRADFSGAQLDQVDMSGTRLSKVIFSKASLVQAQLAGANLSDADLSGAAGRLPAQPTYRATLGNDLGPGPRWEIQLHRVDAGGADLGSYENVVAAVDPQSCTILRIR